MMQPLPLEERMEIPMRSWIMAFALVGLALGAWGGCSGTPSESSPTPSESPNGGIDASPAGEGSLEDDQAATLTQARGTRRLSVDQLEATLPVIAGSDQNGASITWTYSVRGTPLAATDDRALGKTLGRPDYVSVTAEPAQPDMLYVKFMDDMARDVCAKMLSADLARSNPSSRTLVRFASTSEVGDSAAIRENLRYLRLRFWGDKVTDDARLAPEQSLFEQAVATAAAAGQSSGEQAQAGWKAVCVGMLNAPAFHLY